LYQTTICSVSAVRGRGPADSIRFDPLARSDKRSRGVPQKPKLFWQRNLSTAGRNNWLPSIISAWRPRSRLRRSDICCRSGPGRCVVLRSQHSKVSLRASVLQGPIIQRRRVDSLRILTRSRHATLSFNGETEYGGQEKEGTDGGGGVAAQAAARRASDSVSLRTHQPASPHDRKRGVAAYVDTRSICTSVSARCVVHPNPRQCMPDRVVGCPGHYRRPGRVAKTSTRRADCGVYGLAGRFSPICRYQQYY